MFSYLMRAHAHTEPKLSKLIQALSPQYTLHHHRRDGRHHHAQGQSEPHGCISFRYKRRAGRVHAESLLYTLMSSGRVSLVAPPVVLAAAITAEALVALSFNAPREVSGCSLRGAGQSVYKLRQTHSVTLSANALKQVSQRAQCTCARTFSCIAR